MPPLPLRSVREVRRGSGAGGGNTAILRLLLLDGTLSRRPDDPNALARGHQLALVSNIDDDLLGATPLGREFDLVCTAERARGYKPDGTLFRYLLEASGLPVSHILHSGQSQFTDMVGGKPLGLTIAWINRRGLDLDPSVPRPDLILSGLQPLCGLLGRDGAAGAGGPLRRASG